MQQIQTTSSLLPPQSDIIASIFGDAIRAAIPDTLLTVSEWADTYRFVSQGPETGTKWKTSKVPPLKDILDAVTNRNIQQIIFWSSSRVGKTEGLLNNVIGYFAHIDPCPIMIVQPTLEAIETYSRDRLTAMISETPVLRDLVQDPRTRDSGNTVLHKEFRGGHISLRGANSPTGLRAEDIRILLLDEISAFPISAGGQGDPIKLAMVRTRQFKSEGDALVIMTSSPLIKGTCRIEAAYGGSDMCRLFVPCLGCGEMQEMVWSSIVWSELDLPPDKACFRCPGCGWISEDDDKQEMLANYKWTSAVAEANGLGHLPLDEWYEHKLFKGIAGFKMLGTYSPWITWGEMAVEQVEAKRAKSYEQLQVWVNSTLGELWEPGEGLDEDELAFHREEYEAEVPSGVVLLTFGTDTHPDRLETEIVGWGLNEESWSIDYRVFYGDTSVVSSPDPDVETPWDKQREYLEHEWQHELGLKMKVRAGCIDSAGGSTDAVYRFCKGAARDRKLWWAIIGASIPGRPIAPKRPTRKGKLNVKLYSIGTEVAKDKIAAAMRIALDEKTGLPTGPGFCHFPDHYTEDYFKQLTAEHSVPSYHRGYSVRVWKKKKAGARNEAFDCRVYALAAREILNPNLKQMRKHQLEMIARLQTVDGADDAQSQDGDSQDKRRKPHPASPRNFRIPRRRGGFVHNF
jgi:phage terminase large subunit GpA-like protein